MRELPELHRAALEIFNRALGSVDAAEAVRQAVRLEGSRLLIHETVIDLAERRAGIYSIGIGKAAPLMAAALDEILGDYLTAGFFSGPFKNLAHPFLPPRRFSTRWRWCEGGHPLPNKASLRAAQSAFELLRQADDEGALIIFLISGGGSAMIEWPRHEQTTLEELQEANRILVSCGATIAEINSVRRAFSAVKGGGLAARAPRAEQISLIVSDTNTGEETNVASGPTFEPPRSAPDAAEVVSRYKLGAMLPASILRAIERPAISRAAKTGQGLRRHYVLLDNGSAMEAAAVVARAAGFRVEMARDLVEQPIAEGCSELLLRLSNLRRRTKLSSTVCLVSGGEFACPVKGVGTGGRNSETALRCAIESDRFFQRGASGASPLAQAVFLSAGTDGVDGNSPAAGALADETTLARARAMNLDAQKFLDESDAYTFFHKLGDAIITGPTGTNVRDLRIMLAS